MTTHQMTMQIKRNIKKSYKNLKAMHEDEIRLIGLATEELEKILLDAKRSHKDLDSVYEELMAKVDFIKARHITIEMCDKHIGYLKKVKLK